MVICNKCLSFQWYVLSMKPIICLTPAIIAFHWAIWVEFALTRVGAQCFKYSRPCFQKENEEELHFFFYCKRIILYIEALQINKWIIFFKNKSSEVRYFGFGDVKWKIGVFFFILQKNTLPRVHMWLRRCEDWMPSDPEKEKE